MLAPKVIATPLPASSPLHERIKANDFIDCYRVDADVPVRKAAEIITDFPNWAGLLLKLRRLVTTPFGLSNDGPESDDKVGIFPVESETATEIIAGFNDRHLNFRVSVISKNNHVYLATWVHRHNFGGRLYLAMILPFHILIARDALKRVATAT